MHEAFKHQLGEIYVIAVDPDFQGHGLGRQLVLAGLASLCERGGRTGMLYVDHDNEAARKLYFSLGFIDDHTDRAYVTDVPPSGAGQPSGETGQRDGEDLGPALREPLRPGSSRARGPARRGASYRVNQVLDGFYRRLAEPGELTDLPRALRDRLEDAPEAAMALRCVAESVADNGSTLKWLFETRDAKAIEAVLMRYRDRTTVCVSSQAGCAMACTFCATGDAGFSRQLSSGEIVEQVVMAARRCRSEGWGQLGNVVLMGMGEPLANFDAVWTAVEAMNRDLGLAARHLTISTVGVVPGIRRLAGKSLQVNLAVSLHAANDSLPRPARAAQPPVSPRHGDGGLRAVPGLDREEDLFRVGLYRRRQRPPLRRWRAGGTRPTAAGPREPHPPQPDTGRARERAERIRSDRGSCRCKPGSGEWGVNATIRQNRGRSIDAACGQLAARCLARSRRRGVARWAHSGHGRHRSRRARGPGRERCSG